MDFSSIFLSILLTAVAYMAFPLIRLLINGGKFPKKKAHTIALWNSIVLGLIFCIVTIELSEGNTTWNAAPAVLYYWINRAILMNKNIDDEVPAWKTQNIKTTTNRSPQISEPTEQFKQHGNYSVPLNEVQLDKSMPDESSVPPTKTNATNNIKKIKYCRKCGSNLIEGALFCNKCGTKIIVEMRDKK